MTQILHVGRGLTVDVRGLTLADGRGTLGGAVHNEGRLTLTDCTVRDSEVAPPPNALIGGEGGGLYNTGTLILDHTTVTGNRAEPPGPHGRGGAASSTACPAPSR